MEINWASRRVGRKGERRVDESGGLVGIVGTGSSMGLRRVDIVGSRRRKLDKPGPAEKEMKGRIERPAVDSG